MKVNIAKAPGLVKALRDVDFPMLRRYFDDRFQVEGDCIYAFHDPDCGNIIRAALEDYEFNESEEAEKLLSKYGMSCEMYYCMLPSFD